MYSISSALEHLHNRLADDLPHSPGFCFFDAPFPLNDAFDPLAWLASQSVYPQFYWQQRSGEDEAAALGALRHFASLPLAQQFLQQCPDDVRAWGLNAFNLQQGALFLPRLEWRREGGQAILRLYLLSEHSLHDDAVHAADFLQTLTAFKPLASAQQVCVEQRHVPDREGWETLMAQALRALDKAELDKVVLARATDYAFSNAVHAASLMAASRRLNHHCFHFLFAFDAQQAFLGSSPERLWRRRGTALRTEALAGTVASHEDDQQAQRLADWLMSDDKNQRENMLVVEDICQRLQRETGALEVLPPQVIRLRKVQHLRRCIWTDLQTPDDALCLQLLQPTAAVAGLPRREAWAFIQQHEPFEREWYAGSAGYLSRAQSEFCVALRSAKINGNTVRLYAGAGIVPGSDAEQEWQEIENKAAGLRSLL
ncbi:isochorismate hydroxymutase 2, menaquinone biosynthesis [Enterobacter sp. FY-07]|uniref:isochorismate synthase MenF n=1 Tax=Kosakonia oryzendophytica TaxID=1005665 RepID=UPI00077769E3|nr:isochorismate synthase MenF [Kosakonia oryzendophytica]AMO48002.1 isochorismate hydroxymutase 2, menaquinone biosynthesis [Enterobacter sp. FY-07]WBT59677.1 isochorismate synthase MenF [Kosakonia oryzendophytica]